MCVHFCCIFAVNIKIGAKKSTFFCCCCFCRKWSKAPKRLVITWNFIRLERKYVTNFTILNHLQKRFCQKLLELMQLRKNYQILPKMPKIEKVYKKIQCNWMTLINHVYVSNENKERFIEIGWDIGRVRKILFLCRKMLCYQSHVSFSIIVHTILSVIKLLVRDYRAISTLNTIIFY